MLETLAKINLFIVEAQEIYREAYQHIFSKYKNINIISILDVGEKGAILDAVAGTSPNVLLLSVKKLNKDLVDELEIIKNSNPKMGIIVLVMFYSSNDVELMRRLALSCERGLGLFLKQSIDNGDQLSRIIVGVSQEAVILDPTLTTFMFTEKPTSSFLKQLTTREMEILNLLSMGNTNSSIATTLFIDIKTVEHHLNAIYAKLKEDPIYNAKHMRVSSAKLYLETIHTFNQNNESAVRETVTGRNSARKANTLQLPLLPSAR